MLRCHRLSRFFGDRAVLRQVSFECAAGEIVFLAGANGAGKTTLLRILAGALQPTSGSALLDDAPTSSPEARRRTGFLSHQSLLHPSLTVEENLSFYATLFGLPPASAAVGSALAAVNAQSLARRRVAELSQGMRQKAALARCLLHRPRLLLLDEPFASLDLATVAELRATFLRLRSDGLALMLTSHQLEPVAGLPDRTLSLERGFLQSAATALGAPPVPPEPGWAPSGGSPA